MSELDTKYVDEALNYKKKVKKPIWVKWSAMAACLAVVLFIGVSVLTRYEDQQDITPPDNSTIALSENGQCRMMINGIQFIQALLEANGLAAGKDHQFKGRYEAEKNAVIISLENDEREC